MSVGSKRPYSVMQSGLQGPSNGTGNSPAQSASRTQASEVAESQAGQHPIGPVGPAMQMAAMMAFQELQLPNQAVASQSIPEIPAANSANSTPLINANSHDYKNQLSESGFNDESIKKIDQKNIRQR